MIKYLLILIFLLTGCGGEDTINYNPDITNKFNEFPINLSWADIDTDGDGIKENYITRIKRQLCADCYIYAAIGLLEIQFQIDHKIQVDLDLSEQNIHNCLRIACDDTGDSSTILNYLKNYGVPQEFYVPSNNWGFCNNCWDNFVGENVAIPNISVKNIPFFRIGEWETIVYEDMLREEQRLAFVRALQTGPVIMYVGSWKGLEDNNIIYCKEKKLSGHITIVVGYVNHGELFIMKNSHGEGILRQLAWANGEVCGIGNIGYRIIPNSTFISWGWGEKFCYSNDDFDGDGVPDVYDNCPRDPNPDQRNYDGDMLGDICDPCPNDRDELTGFYCDRN